MIFLLLCGWLEHLLMNDGYPVQATCPFIPSKSECNAHSNYHEQEKAAKISHGRWPIYATVSSSSIPPSLALSLSLLLHFLNQFSSIILAERRAAGLGGCWLCLDMTCCTSRGDRCAVLPAGKGGHAHTQETTGGEKMWKHCRCIHVFIFRLHLVDEGSDVLFIVDE